MEFKKPTLEDREELASYLKNESIRSCDYSISNIILWSNFFDCTYAIIEGNLVTKTNDQGSSYSYPVGDGDKKKTIETLMKHCKEQEEEFQLYGVTKEMEEEIVQMFGDIFEITYDRNEADYIYERESLATLKGKKLHGKRNHINYFKNNFDWSYESLNDENQLEALTMLMEWKLENCTPEDIEKHEEICVTKNCLMYYKELGLTGGILRIEDRIVGLTIGEPALNDDTFVVHTEKAFSDVRGAYPMINQQFVIHELEGYTYVNREEDMGEEGLRKAKLSYRPVMMVEKAFLTLK